ncbi:MAG: hypothetical protein JNJ77_08515 [Planctomycetia bacterium]|nr:hypothetical protein [Planctomycetia bacterium]
MILPTGDRTFGLGTGELGYQFNLPISHYGDVFDFHFNIGTTFTPRVSALLENGFLSSAQDLRSFNLGASVYWKPKTNLHFFVEALALSNEEINDLGTRDRLTQVYLNPGVRYAICQLEEVEWVVGVSAPIGLTRDTPDIGLFIYMSIEFGFKKKNDE